MRFRIRVRCFVDILNVFRIVVSKNSDVDGMFVVLIDVVVVVIVIRK